MREANRPSEDVEGVVKYHLYFQAAALKLEAEQLNDLNRARALMRGAGLIGCEPGRYSGLGFGNLSSRSPSRDEFVISATQTGHLKHLDPDQFSLVYRSCPEQNELWARGYSEPSSEAMTHAVIYQSCPKVQAVVHVHSPDIWYHGARLNLRFTAADIPYGTPQMARAVKALVDETGHLEKVNVFTMKGHQDGVVAYGPSLVACTDCLLTMRSKARYLESQQ